MKFEFLFAPTSNLEASYALYRDHFGAEEVWREGDTTIALSLPGTDVQLMLDNNDADAPVGPLFIVESVTDFHQNIPAGLEVLEEPSEIPGGFMATYQDPNGMTIYVMDQASDAAE
jgi:catechol 2,3-dioxygenase-like lactoylglutathione lyase family enzyme